MPADRTSARIRGGSNAAVPRRTLWFTFLGAPIAWAANLLLGYTVQATVCNTAGPEARAHGTPAAVALPVLFSTIAAAVAVAAVVVAYRAWRRTGTGEENPEMLVPADVGRSWFMAYGGLVASLIFLLAIVLVGIVEVTLKPCAGF